MACFCALAGVRGGLDVAVASADQTPVAAYSFDAGEGATAEDVTGNEHDGTIEGASWFDNGKYGKALSFDGENDCVTIADAEDLRITEELTVEAWVKPSSPVSDDPVIYKDTWGETGHAVGIGIYNSGKPEAFIGEGEGEFESVVASKAIEANVWSHLAFTYDGAHMRLYVDGELVASKAQSEGPPWGEGDLMIGCNPNYPEHFEGLIDEVRIYNRALGAGEVAADIGAGLQAPSRLPIAAYSFDAGEGAALEDVTGNEHDGEIEGASWFDNGRFGKALSFDGENDCVTIADSADLQLSEDFTLEAWVKPKDDGGSEPILFKEKPYFGAYALYYGLEGEGDIEGLIGDEWEFRRAIDGADQDENVWLHVALAYDGAHMRLYVNGELIDTSSADDVESSSGDLSIGCSQEFGDNFEGLIDEVRIYNRALGAGEVAADIGAGLQAPSRLPIAAYSFDAGEGETLEDVTGNEHDGEIEGASWFDNGRFGKALSFDGENDCVTIADSADLQLSEDFTLEAWVKPKDDGGSEPILFKEKPYFGAYALYYGLEGEGDIEGLIGDEWEFRRAIDGADQDENVWLHVALAYDGAHMRLYVNGELIDTSSADDVESSSGDLSIGCSQEFGDNFEGLIDEVRIYNRALGAGEVAADIGAGLQAPSRLPIAAYSFDAGEGETLEDVTGNEHDGEIEGASWFDNGRFGKALSFDGENDCVTIADAEDLRITEELTVEAWVKPSSPVSDDPVIYKDTWGETGHAVGIGIYNSGKPEAFIGEGEGEFESVVASKAIEANVWSHLAFTYDGAHMRLYVDGELVASKAQSEGPPWGEGDLMIGCNPNYPEHFEGLIDEVRIYNRALGAGEVAADIGAGLQAPSRLPIAAYSFDAGEGAALEDVTGNEHDGEIEGASWFDNGRFGKALSFDGEEGECVTVPDAEELRTTEEFTLEAWVKPNAPVGDDPIIYKDAWGTGAANELGIGIYSSARPEGFIEGESESESVAGSESIEADVWTHLALTYDGAHMRLYVNGSLAATEAQAEGPQWAEGDLVIGCNPNYSSEVFDGLIDEVRIYNRALDETEVADLRPPRFVEPFEAVAVRLPENTSTAVLFTEANDPPLADNRPGSGVAKYSYRYSLNSGPMSDWLATETPDFLISEASEGQTVAVEVYVSDRVGNRSQAISASTVIPPETYNPPESAEPLEEDNGVGGTGQAFTFLPEDESEGNFNLQAKLPPIRCNMSVGDPHLSKHSGYTRVNAVVTTECKPGVGVGATRALLFFNHQATPVGDSGTEFFYGTKQKSSANSLCKSGTYRSWGTAFVKPPPGYGPPEQKVALFGNTRGIRCLK